MEVESMFGTRTLHPAAGFVLVQGSETEETRASGLIVAGGGGRHSIAKGLVLEVGPGIDEEEFAAGHIIYWLAGHEHEIADYKVIAVRDIIAWEGS